MADLAVVFVKGPDHELRTRALDEVVARLLGDDDRSLALAETRLPAAKKPNPTEDDKETRLGLAASALDGARTPPLGTERRIVVVRSDDGFLAAEAHALAAYLADPQPTTVLVLEAVGRLAGELTRAAKAAGVEEVGGVPHKDATSAVLRGQLGRAGVSLDSDAAALVAERFGEDAGRVPALVDLLASTFGEGAALGASEIAPYLGEAGGPVPVYELTKAIDAGDVPESLAVLHRLTGSMGMHPLQVMAILHNHFRRVLRLDDPEVRSEGDAVEALGGKVHAYPAKLAWQKAQRLGRGGIRRAFSLLAKADRDLRGATGAPDDAVLGVLVTELAMLSKPGARAGSRR